MQDQNLKVDWKKNKNGLVPAVIQDAETSRVLMVGYMNNEALDQTLSSGLVTFFSRSKERLWVKGETSGNHLEFKEVLLDCDADALLIKAVPRGAVCHTGADTCFNETNAGVEKTGKSAADKTGGNLDFLGKLEDVIADRRTSGKKDSYTNSLFEKGINKIAQKVGEEAVELVIESKDDDEELFLNEGADLVFHFLVLLQAKGFTLQNVIDVLEKRHV